MSDTSPAEAYPGAEQRPGAEAPLSAAGCAERAAAAIGQAEQAAVTGNSADTAGWLACAEHWRQLACCLATNPAMNRPRDDRDERGRR